MTVRSVFRSLASVAALCMLANVTTATVVATSAQAACIDDNIRLYRAHALGGGVDTSAGSWIGADYYTGGTVYVSRTGYYRYAAAFGNHLTANTTVYYSFRIGGTTVGEFVPQQPTVGSNSVMNDSQRYSIADNISNGTYAVWVEYVNPCGYYPPTLERQLGYLVITN